MYKRRGIATIHTLPGGSYYLGKNIISKLTMIDECFSGRKGRLGLSFGYVHPRQETNRKLTLKQQILYDTSIINSQFQKKYPKTSSQTTSLITLVYGP